MLALMTAFLATVVVLGHRNVVLFEIAGLSPFHEVQDIQHELEVLWSVLVVLHEKSSDTSACNCHVGLQIGDDLDNGVRSVFG
jgi:hypothetical protein